VSSKGGNNQKPKHVVAQGTRHHHKIGAMTTSNSRKRALEPRREKGTTGEELLVTSHNTRVKTNLPEGITHRSKNRRKDGGGLESQHQLREQENGDGEKVGWHKKLVLIMGKCRG